MAENLANLYDRQQNAAEAGPLQYVEQVVGGRPLPCEGTQVRLDGGHLARPRETGDEHVEAQ